MNGFDILTDRREAIVITAGTAITASAAILPLALGSDALAAPVMRHALKVGRDQPFDTGWRFTHSAGESPENPGLDDSAWRTVNLPHDWSIETLPGGQTGPFHKESKGGTATGFSEGGEGWYRKHFTLDGLPKDARVEIMFDGIYIDSEIWLNGKSIGSNLHGYRPFACDLTPYLKRDGSNVLAVRVRNLGQNSRWYSGSGIYRQVKLDVMPATTRLARWGVGASTRRMSGGVAEIDVTTRVESPDSKLQLVTRLRDAKGVVAAEVKSSAVGDVKQTLKVKAPHLWSPNAPYLYTLETEVQRNSVIIDRMVQPFGVRIITMDAQRGMQINGKTTKLRGGCIHHDNGLLGSCAYPDADARRVRQLKARGYNAIRSSHNPASRSLREACDRLGMLIIEEAFDVWHVAKLPEDFHVHFKDHWHEVIEAMVLSARNSPSVMMWSIGNEIPYRATPEGVEWEWKLANAVRTLDPTRPVTAGLNGTLGAPMIASAASARAGRADKLDNASSIFLDVPGYNYRLEDIENEHKAHPERVVYASETFPHDVFDYQALSERAPYFLGEFVWTAMDYLGEAGVGEAALIKKGAYPIHFAGWPWVNAWCGDIDLIGNQKPPSLARDVAWGISPLEMTVHRPIPDDKQEFIAPWGWADELQSWNWAGAEGKPLSVCVYSSADRVELRLNGKTVGSKTLAAADKMQAAFKVPYAPGVLEAVAWRHGKIVARRTLETVGAPAKLRLVTEHAASSGDPHGLSYVGVQILDTKDRVIPEDMRKISLKVDGAADLIAFGSANPQAVGSLQSHEAQSFRGKALAILRAQGKPGTVRITAHSEGLSAASTIIRLV